MIRFIQRSISRLDRRSKTRRRTERYPEIVDGCPVSECRNVYRYKGVVVMRAVYHMSHGNPHRIGSMEWLGDIPIHLRDKICDECEGYQKQRAHDAKVKRKSDIANLVTGLE